MFHPLCARVVPPAADGASVKHLAPDVHHLRAPSRLQLVAATSLVVASAVTIGRRLLPLVAATLLLVLVVPHLARASVSERLRRLLHRLLHRARAVASMYRGLGADSRLRVMFVRI